MAQHNIVGAEGEAYAAKIMREKGYKVIDVNWKVGHLEMDVIAENKTEIVFVEVKTRTSLYNNKRPEEYVDAIKKRRLVAAANAYIKWKKIDKTPRFDIIGILMDKTTGAILEVNHIENAFIPPQRTINKNSFSGNWRWLHRGKVIG